MWIQEIHSTRENDRIDLRKRGLVDDVFPSIIAAARVLVDDRIVEKRVEIAFLRGHRLIEIEEEIADHGDFRRLAIIAPAADGAGRVR